MLLVYILVMLMMFYVYEKYDMNSDYDVNVWGIFTCALIMWWYVFDVDMLIL